MSDLWFAIAIVIALFVAALGAIAETVVLRMARIKAEQMAQENQKRADVLVRIVEDPASYMNAVLLVTLIAQITGTALATALAARHLGSIGWAAAAAVMSLLVFVFASLVPKTFAIQRLEVVALLMARPIYALGRLLKPLSSSLVVVANAVMVLLPGKGLPEGPFVTEEEIRHLVDVAEKEEEIEEEERELIHSIFEFGDTIVREVMVPRPDMIVVPSDASLHEAMNTVIQAGYSRIPIFEGDTDNIVGVLYAKDVMKRLHEGDESAKVRDLGRAPVFVPELKKVSELLREMQQQHVHMAIVVDEYGGTAGLATIEDLIEEIVGEIVDEYDREEPLVEPIGDGSIRVDAKMPIDEVNELLGVDLPHEEWDTVGGLVFGLVGRVPTPGETVDYDSLRFRAERVSGRRIQKVVITKQPPQAAPERE